MSPARLRLVGADDTPTPPRGEARRAHILDAALRIIGRTGPDALTHRAVAAEARLPLAATTYWFASKDELLAEAYAVAAGRDVARIAQLSLDLERDGFPSGKELSRHLADMTMRELHRERSGLLASYALWLETARRPELREVSLAWTEAYLGFATTMLAAAGSPTPEADARLLVATLDGLQLEQLAHDSPGFEWATLRPALDRLIAALLA